MKTNKIIWKNEKIYDHATIVERINLIEKHMNGLLPLYGKEKENLILYAKKNNLSAYEIISLRNTIRIQKEINSSKKFMQSIGMIKNKFKNLILELKNHDQNKNNSKIKYFLKSTNMPFFFFLKTITVMPEFKELTAANINFIKKLDTIVHKIETEIRERSMKFEHILENYLKSLNIEFRTETDIKRDKDYNVTPDILFDEPIVIELGGTSYMIRWLDAKNYLLTDTSFIMKSLQKQAAKYNDIFGMGAFVFHYGFDSSIKIPGVLILDGSMIEKNTMSS